jgi:prevent-host-death family protein
MSTVLDPLPIDSPSAAFAEAVARTEAAQVRIILTRDGKPVAALVPISDLDSIEDAEDRTAAAAALAEHERSGQNWPTYTVEQLAAKWGIDPSDDAIE